MCCNHMISQWKETKKKKQGRSVGEKLKNGERGEGRVSNIGGLHKTVEELATFCQLCLIIAALSSIQSIYYTMSPKLASFCFDRKCLTSHQIVENDRQIYEKWLNLYQSILYWSYPYQNNLSKKFLQWMICI